MLAPIRFLAAGLAALGLGAAVAQTVALPGPVVDAAWLAANLDAVQVVDVRSNARSFTTAPEFEKDPKTGKSTLVEPGGHIAGSRLIEMRHMRTDRQIGGNTVKYMIPERAVFEKAIQAAGVDAGKPIVLVPVGVDVADVDDALRVYWQLKVYGEDRVAVLDGGLAGWLVDGRPVVTDAAAPRNGTWVASADRTDRYMAGSEDVSRAIASRGATLVDGRDAKQFHGLVRRDYVATPGHIEGARLYPTDLMFRSAGGALRFYRPDTYRALMAAQGIDPAREAITYCNSGQYASGPWFVMSELLGNRTTRLYDGSLHQWTLEKRPTVGAVPIN